MHEDIIMTEQTYDLGVLFVNTTNVTKLYEFDQEYSPGAIVVPKDQGKAISADPAALKTAWEKQEAIMKADPSFSSHEMSAKARYTKDPSMGHYYMKLYKLVTGYYDFILFDKKTFKVQFTHPLHLLMNGSELKHNGYKIDIRLNSSEDVLIFETNKVVPRLYEDDYYYTSSEADFVDDPNDKLKIYASKKTLVYNENKLLNDMIDVFKEINLESFIKAIDLASKHFTNNNLVEASLRLGIDVGHNRSVGLKSLTAKAKSRKWVTLMDKFIEYVRYFFQEKKEVVAEKMRTWQGEQLEEEVRQEVLLWFKGKELDPIHTSEALRNHLALHDGIIDILINGFDMSKVPRIVEPRTEERETLMYFLSSKENKGEEMKKQVKEFITLFITNPYHLVKFWIRLVKSIVDKDPHKMENIARLLEYMHKELLSVHGKKICDVLENSDELRDSYFKLSVQLVEIITKSEYRKYDFTAVRWLITEFVLNNTPNLPNEFYKKLFTKTNLLSKDVFKDYFQNKLITKEDKAEMMFFFLKNTAETSANLADVLEEFIINPLTIENLTMKDLFAVLNIRYTAAPGLLDRFIKKEKLCTVHLGILRAINRVMHSGNSSSKTFLLTQKDSYFMQLYTEICKFVDTIQDDLSILYINVPEYLNVQLVRFLGDFRDPSLPSTFAQIITRYHDRLGVIQNNLTYYISVMEKVLKYMLEYEFADPLLSKLKKFRDDINTFSIVQIETDKDYVDCTCLKDPIWDVYSICQEYKIFYQELKSKCSKNISLTAYKSAIDKYCVELKTRLIGFLDDKKYTLKDMYYHFHRIMEQKNIEIYDAAVKALGLTEPQRKTLFNHSRAFHSLLKTFKLRDSIKTLIGFDFLTFSSSAFVDKISQVCDALKSKPYDKITYADVIQTDAKTKILITDDYSKCKVYLLPMLIKWLAVSPDTIKFMKEKGTDFIKSMKRFSQSAVEIIPNLCASSMSIIL